MRPEKQGASHMVTRLMGSRAGYQDQDPDRLDANPLLFPITQLSFPDKKQIKTDSIKVKFLSEQMYFSNVPHHSLPLPP